MAADMGWSSDENIVFWEEECKIPRDRGNRDNLLFDFIANYSFLSAFCV